MAIHQVANVAGKILEAKAPDAGRVGRFRFENFSGHVRDLVNGHLLPGATGVAP